jgi:peroxiredoxin
LRRDYGIIKDEQTEILFTGPDDEAAFKEYWRKENLQFPGIADPHNLIANQYQQEVKFLKMGRMPSFFIIDREGLARFRQHGKSMSDIPRNKEVIALLKKLNDQK